MMIGSDLVCVIATTAFVSGVFLGAFLERKFWRLECVSRGVAAYDPQTGKWKWMVEKKERGQ